MYYEYQRWYDPSIGRFISQDPLTGILADPQSLNAYLYVQNLPTSATDPSGMDSCGAWGWLASFGCVVEGWNSLPTWGKVAIIGGVIVAVGAVTGGVGLVAAPEIATGLGGAEVASAMGVGDLTATAGFGFLGGVSLGDLGGLGLLGVSTGLLGLADFLSGSSAMDSGVGNGWQGFGLGGGSSTGLIVTSPGPTFGNPKGRPPDVPPDVKDPNKIRPPRWREPGKTIPSAPGKPSPSTIKKAVCAALGLGGLGLGLVVRAETSDTGLNYPIAGGIAGLTACLAYLKW